LAVTQNCIEKISEKFPEYNAKKVLPEIPSRYREIVKNVSYMTSIIDHVNAKSKYFELCTDLVNHAVYGFILGIKRIYTTFGLEL